MGSSASSHNAPPRKPVPAGKTRICVAGFKVSPHTGRARWLAYEIARQHPDLYETWFYFDSSAEFYYFLKETFDPVPFPQHLKGHSSSPFVWIEQGLACDITPIGGREHFAKWAAEKFPEEKEILDIAKNWKFSDSFHNGDKAYPCTADVSVEAVTKKA